MKRTPAALLTCAFCTNGFSAALPSEIQSCLNITCLVDQQAVFSVANIRGLADANGVIPSSAMSAYNFYDFSTGTQKLLIEYSLVQPSQSAYSNGLDAPSAILKTGTVWLLLNEQYDLGADSHRLRVFWDQVPGGPGSELMNPGYTDVIFNNAALLGGSLREDFNGLAGSAAQQHYGNASFVYQSSGYPGDAHAFAYFCLYNECEEGFAQLDFLYFTFSDSDADGVASIAFHPSAANGLLFQSRLNDTNGSSYTTDLYAPAAVPLPPAAALLVSGLGLLFSRSGRTRIAGPGKQAL